MFAHRLAGDAGRGAKLRVVRGLVLHLVLSVVREEIVKAGEKKACERSGE